MQISSKEFCVLTHNCKGQSLFHYFIRCDQFCHQRKYFLRLHSSFFALKPLAPRHCGCLCAWAVQCTSQLWLCKFTLELETSVCGTFVPKHPGLKRVGGFVCMCSVGCNVPVSVATHLFWQTSGQMLPQTQAL